MKSLKSGFIIVFEDWSGQLWLLIYILFNVLSIGLSLSTGCDIKSESSFYFFNNFFLFSTIYSGLLLHNAYESVIKSPSAICIPGFGKALRFFRLFCGIVLGFFVALQVLLIRDINETEKILLGSGLFLLIINTFLMVRKTIWIMAFLLIAVYTILYLCAKGVIRSLCLPLSGYIITGVFLLVVSWHWLGDEQIRNRQRELIAGKSKKRGKKKKQISPWISDYFNRCVLRSKVKATGRYIWGTLHVSLGKMLSGFKWLFLESLGIAIILGLLLPKQPVPMIALGFLLVASHCKAHITLHDELLIYGGRRERFWGALAAVLTEVVIIGGAMIIIAGISQLTRLLVTELGILGGDVGFNAINMNLITLTACILPVAWAVEIYFVRAPILTFIIGGIISIPLFIFSPEIIDLAESGNLIFLLSSLVVCWLVFLITLLVICKDRDLILQSLPYYEDD